MFVALSKCKQSYKHEQHVFFISFKEAFLCSERKEGKHTDFSMLKHHMLLRLRF